MYEFVLFKNRFSTGYAIEIKCLILFEYVLQHFKSKQNRISKKRGTCIMYIYTYELNTGLWRQITRNRVKRESVDIVGNVEIFDNNMLKFFSIFMLKGQ
jgi:hypothetical protein